jgi:serine/threonine protein phosphatase PrpC
MTDVGISRVTNQDRTIACPEIGFFGVTDGMGGHKFGEETAIRVASAMPKAVELFLNELGTDQSPQQAAGHLKHAIMTESKNIYQMGNNISKYDHGATLSCVLLIGDHAIFGNLGDSRGYVIRRKSESDGMQQMTTDHNLANELVESGKLSKEEAKNHFSSKQLIMYMGMDPPAVPETIIFKVEHEDRILLCSDGVYGMLSEEKIFEIFQRIPDSQDIVKELVDAANAAGGGDNISAVVVEISQRTSKK